MLLGVAVITVVPVMARSRTRTDAPAIVPRARPE